jgi:CheY-like chemotaxis protein
MDESVSEVYILDDDVSVREAVGSLIRSVGLKVRTFASAQEFLTSLRKERPSCLVLDVQLPDINGFELQQELATKDIQIPIIFLTGHGDIPMSVRAIKAGALEFLTKPFEDEYLLEAIRNAIARQSKVGQPQGSVAGDSCEDDAETDVASRAMPPQAEICVFSAPQWEKTGWDIRRNYRSKYGVATNHQTNRDGGAHGRHRPDPRRNRHRERANRTRTPPAQSPER